MLEFSSPASDNTLIMDKKEKDLLSGEISKKDSKIRCSKFGMLFFPTAFLVAAIGFLILYLYTRQNENLIIAVLMALFTVPSFHGYRRRLTDLRAEKQALENKLEEAEDRTC